MVLALRIFKTANMDGLQINSGTDLVLLPRYLSYPWWEKVKEATSAARSGAASSLKLGSNRSSEHIGHGNSLSPMVSVNCLLRRK